VIATIARLTVLEAVRRRLVWVLGLLTLLSVAFTGWGIERLVTLARIDGVPEIQIQIGVSQILILVAFMFSFVLAMTAAFLAAPAIAGQVESGVILAIAARPIRRWEILLGTWLGLVVLIAGYAAAAGLLEIAVVRVLTGYGPPQPLAATAFLAGQAVILLTLGLVLGTRLPSIASGAIAVVAFGLGWMAGVLAGVGAFFGVPLLEDAARAARLVLPSDLLWRGVVFALEPPAIVLITAGRRIPELSANPFYAAAPPPIEAIAWSVAWTVLMLATGAWLLRRREL
jgi:ABC-type transport system involved in multi-copper enzyme maturation permease subunit